MEDLTIQRVGDILSGKEPIEAIEIFGVLRWLLDKYNELREIEMVSTYYSYDRYCPHCGYEIPEIVVNLSSTIKTHICEHCGECVEIIVKFELR